MRDAAWQGRFATVAAILSIACVLLASVGGVDADWFFFLWWVVLAYSALACGAYVIWVLDGGRARHRQRRDG